MGASPFFSSKGSIMNSQNTTQEAAYFDLTTEGLGYLNRIRTVSGKKVTPYLACTIKALNGPTDDVEYRECDLIVVGSQAQEVVRQLEADVVAQKRVLVGFRFGDASPNAYEVTNRETGVVGQRLCIKGRLLQITWAKVDGQNIDIPLVERKVADAANDDETRARATGTNGPVLNTGSAGA
jgi:Protein of unknown function (DUF3577)